jgi:hypothetical protein
MRNIDLPVSSWRDALALLHGNDAHEIAPHTVVCRVLPDRLTVVLYNTRILDLMPSGFVVHATGHVERTTVSRLNMVIAGYRFHRRGNNILYDDPYTGLIGLVAGQVLPYADTDTRGTLDARTRALQP